MQGVFCTTSGVAPDAETWGTMALCVLDAADVTHRTAWAKRSWGDSLLDFWDDLTGDGRLDERNAEGVDTPIASLAATIVLPPGETRALTFLLAWHFPNRLTWTPEKAGLESPVIGNYYATVYADAWDAAVRAAPNLPTLEADTVAFVRAFCESDLPAVVKEAALFNVSTLRTQTCFRTPDGRLFGWEGCGDKKGCCVGTCTHVWNYEQATAFLFGNLSRTLREVELAYATVPTTGYMSFRAHLPLAFAAEGVPAAADGQMGCLMKLYRDWRLCGDDDFLRALWPRAKKALEFCWIPGGWDADKDGVMEGCQHNTMDVEYFGPNPQMGAWYLGALRACEEMARYLGDTPFADTCHDLFARGSAWLDAHLFNGEYYEHHIVPPAGEAATAPGLRLGAGAKNLAEPELQLGAGCLIDQLAGQYLSHVCGLGYLLDKNNVQTTLASILKYNGRSSMRGHFNHLRTFALGDESALLMASYPRGNRPRRPFPYYNEVMTGFEYTAAVGLLYEGRIDEGVQVIADVRARYDGRKRSPFNEAECGHHYARAMASWGAVLALTGFGYDGVTQTMTFAAAGEPATWFWSNGSAWGTCAQEPASAENTRIVRLSVGQGRVALRRLQLRGVGALDLTPPQEITAGETATFVVRCG